MSGVAPDPLDRIATTIGPIASPMVRVRRDDVLALVEVARSLERLVADLETNSEHGAPDYAHEALARLEGAA